MNKKDLVLTKRMCALLEQERVIVPGSMVDLLGDTYPPTRYVTHWKPQLINIYYLQATWQMLCCPSACASPGPHRQKEIDDDHPKCGRAKCHSRYVNSDGDHSKFEGEGKTREMVAWWGHEKDGN